MNNQHESMVMVEVKRDLYKIPLKMPLVQKGDIGWVDFFDWNVGASDNETLLVTLANDTKQMIYKRDLHKK